MQQDLIAADAEPRGETVQLSVWNLMRSMAGIEAGRHCRRCNEPLARRDGFAMSEGVCGPCRVAAD